MPFCAGRSGVFDSNIIASPNEGFQDSARDPERRISESETQRTDSIVTSLGYRSDYFVSPHSVTTSLFTQGMGSGIIVWWYDPSLTCVRNVSGSVYGVSGALVRGVYSSGWAANRARGMLGSAMYDTHSVAETLVADPFSSEAGGGRAGVFCNPGVIVKIVLAADAWVKILLDSDGTGTPSLLRKASIQQGTSIVHYERWKIIDEVSPRVGSRFDHSFNLITSKLLLTIGLASYSSTPKSPSY